jgi:HEAT repeat protein
MRRPRLRFLALAVLGLSVGQLAAAADKQEPSYKGKPLSAWVADLKSGDADTRFDAAIALGRLGPLAAPAVPDLIRLFKEKDQDVAGAARIALRRIGKPAVPALLRALADKSEDVADSAKATLSRIGEPAVGPLLDAIRGPNADLRRRAASALIWMDRSV